MTPRWLLDTSALLVLRDDEGGAERVAGLFQAAQQGESRCLVCFMSRMEVQSLPIAWVGCSDGLLEQAAAIKPCQPLSLAGAWIAAAPAAFCSPAPPM